MTSMQVINKTALMIDRRRAAFRRANLDMVE